MPKIIEGGLVASGLRFGVLAARWNDFITNRLLDGALDTLLRHGADEANITVAKVPGCFEIPLATKKMADSGKYDAVVALGTLIRGATPHFDYIASEVTKGIATIGLDSGIPCAYGIITADTLEQAIERAGTKAGNKGNEAALAAIEMANLLKRFSEDG